ncbi:MAG: HypC/HybG/HupF family hydrogenase formation chaperone [Verrucomicrobia bacterium]|nr:HypC/HybG/HupF family hydrogenase formation chaperone [Verrucomicrobiota bacterium]
MCLAIPGQVLTVDTAADPWNRTGRVLFGTIEKTINLAYVPAAEVGDYVLVHVGFALQQIDPEEAARIWEILRAMEELQDLEEATKPLREVSA